MPTPTIRTLAAYEAQALARLPTQFRGKPRLQSLLMALAGQHQDAEAGLYTLWAYRQLDTATGSALEQLGEVVGQERGGLTDESFRPRIYARLLINRSSGTIPELLAIFALISPLLATITEYPPAAFELTLSGGAASLPEDFAAILQAARAGGVGAGLLYQTEADADTFTFEGGTGLGFPSPLGFIGPAETLAAIGAPPPEITSDGPVINSVTLRVRAKAFGGGDFMLFEYRFSPEESFRELDDYTLPGDETPLYTATAVLTSLRLTHPTPTTPYDIGDTWEWVISVPTEGGSLTGILSA